MIPRKIRWDARSIVGIGFNLLFSDETIELGSKARRFAQAIDSSRSAHDLKLKLDRVAGRRLSNREVSEIVKALDGLFDGPAAEAERVAAFQRHVSNRVLDIRSSYFLEKRPTWLAEQIRSHRKSRRSSGRLVGALSPHGELSQTSPASFRVFSCLSPETWPDVFVVLASSHYETSPSILTYDVRTSLGTIGTDVDLAHAIQASMSSDTKVNSPAFLVDHSWQIDLPIIQTLANQFRRRTTLVVVLVGRNTSFRDGLRLGEAVSKTLFEQRKRAVVIASGDLSHFGQGYDWSPSWLKSKRRVGDVVAALLSFEQTALTALEQRNCAEFERVVIKSSFCARSQVGALMTSIPVAGKVVSHASIVNWSPQFDKNRPWTKSDKVFDVASVAFRLAEADANKLRESLCREVLIHVDRKSVRLFHPCDNEEFALPRAALEPLLVLMGGVVSPTKLARRVSQRIEQPVSTSLMKAFILNLRGRSLLHGGTSSSARLKQNLKARSRDALAYARANVRAYSGLRSNDVAKSPFLTSTMLAEGGRSYFADRVATRSWPVLERDFVVRISSGSSGQRQVVSVVEKSTHGQRAAAELLIGNVPAKTARINRLTNLFGPREIAIRRAMGEVPGEHLYFREDPDGSLCLSPGQNPTNVSDSLWSEIVARLEVFGPAVLEGDPAFIAGLARHCRSHSGKVKGLRRIELAHSYAWESMVSQMSRTFDVPIRRRLNSSELGTIAMECDLGFLHLLESQSFYEVITRGRASRSMELGALVATTLDTKIRPLVRYVVGDVVKLISNRCRCGKPFRTMSFEGRLSSLFRNDKGQTITQRMLDKAIGSPVGATFFRWRITGDGPIQLDLMLDHPNTKIDVVAIRDKVSDSLAIDVKVDVVKSLSASEKLLTLDRESGASKRFLPLSRFLGAGH